MRVPRRTRVLLLTGTLVVLAGVAWSATARTRSVTARRAASATVKHAPAAKPAPAIASAATRGVKAPAAPKQAAGAAGMRIFKDPETGEIGPPTAENAAAIAREQPEVDVTNIPQVRLANGGYELLIDGRIEDAVVMQIDKNGNRVVRCVQDSKTALKQTPQAPAAQREER